MAATGLEVFDTTIQKTNSWLNDIARISGCSSKHEAYQALRATLHALRDRLTIEEVAEFAAQLPMLIRGLYYESWDPTGKPLKLRHKEEFLTRIEQELRGADQLDPEAAARAVFCVISLRITEGEVADIRHLMPARLRELWPDYVEVVAENPIR
jgi:uncharacterized protein (DUF2267 family)